jgi:uncharacterized protein
MRRLLVAVIRLYQLVLSPWFGGCCRFYPSCSKYASEAIEQYGALKGTGMAVRRVLKCHPFHPGGVDPVPVQRCCNTESTVR